MNKQQIYPQRALTIQNIFNENSLPFLARVVGIWKHYLDELCISKYQHFGLNMFNFVFSRISVIQSHVLTNEVLNLFE